MSRLKIRFRPKLSGSGSVTLTDTAISYKCGEISCTNLGNFDGIGDKVIYLISFPLIKGMYECLVILYEDVDEI
jgi:hypothetical protein